MRTVGFFTADFGFQSQQTHNAPHFLFVPRQYGGNPPMTVTAFVPATDFTHGGFGRCIGTGFADMVMKAAFGNTGTVRQIFQRVFRPQRLNGFAALAAFFSLRAFMCFR
ncbi:hypothetical protein CGZ65_01805 [Neisseria weixii]|nr:hypothetical protein CGZ65_01805 [Neisseria weixii]